MILGILTFLSALTISAVAIYYSVAGLAAIFAAAVIPIIVMGVALEVGKLITAVWLHRYWSQAAWWLKTYLSLAVFILMFITSMGIFGFLSKAHIEQTSLSQEQVALIETLDDKETRSQAKIDRWRGELDRLLSGEDIRVDSLVEKEEEGLDKIYARINKEKDALRADAKFKVEQQQTRIEQAQDRRDAEIAAAEKKFEGTLGGTKQYEDAVSKAKQNELSVASRAQKEILAVNTKLDEDLAKIDTKYAGDIKAINDRIQNLRNQANTKTVDIDSRVEELEGLIEVEQTNIDEVNEEKFGYEKEYRKLEAEVGPIKYIAEFIYGEDANQNLLEAAVRWVIIIIIFVFDPLAVLLLIASQYTFNWNRSQKGGSLPGKPDPDPNPPFTDDEWEQAHRDNYEFDRAKKIDENIPPEVKNENNTREDSKNTEEGTQASSETQDEESIQGQDETDPTVDGTKETVVPQLSKKNTDQYLLWSDVDPDPQESVEQTETNPQKIVDSNQGELDFNERFDGESEEEYVKRIWKKENPGHTIELQKRLKNKGLINEVPWADVDNTISDMKNEGEWPKQNIDDLDAWNEWVEKANKEAENNPEPVEKAQYTDVIEPTGFIQNEEQSEKGIFNKINEARVKIDFDGLKQLEISEEQYRDASQRNLMNKIQRLKDGLITIDDLSSSEKDKIAKLIKEDNRGTKN